MSGKITVSSNATVIPVPKSLRDFQSLYVETITIEGTKDHAKKLVIKHRPIIGRAPDKIVVDLRGSTNTEEWDEFEGQSLNSQYEANLMKYIRLSYEKEHELFFKKAALNGYLHDFLIEDENGKRIMEMIRRRNQQLQQKLDRGAIPDYDKVVRESCEHLKAKYHIVTIWETGQMYYFKEGKYVEGAERIIEEECFGLFQYDARSYMVEEIKKKLKAQTYKNLEEFDADINIINVKNGLYHIKEKTLTAHTPDYLSLEQKPIVYDPNAKCPIFEEKYLAQCLYPSQIKTVKQCAAYTFYRANPFEHYVIHVGYGWNGKTKLNNVMAKLHGEENVSYVPFNDISKDPYALSDLERKALNIDNEPSGGVIRNTAILKKVSGNELVRVQQKYVKAHNARLHAKLWFSTNDIPDIQDESIGRYRREIVIVWPYTFKPNPNPNNPMEKQDDPDIEDKITTDAELSGIFKILMDELHDILYKQKKRIHVDMSDIEQRKRHRQLLLNPTQFFVEDVIDLDNSNSESYVRKDDLYAIYEKFSELNKVLPEDKKNFGRKLKKILEERLIDGQKEPQSEADPVTGKRRRIWKGIKVKDEWKDEDKRDKQTSLLSRSTDEEETEEQQLALSQMSDMSKRNQENKSPKQENMATSDDNLSSKQPENNIDFLFSSLPKRENARTSGTPNVSIDCSSMDIDGIIRTSMRDSEGNNKGYFTKDDWLFTCQLYPNLHCSIEQSEQVLNQLLRQAKIIGLEGGKKYQPTK